MKKLIVCVGAGIFSLAAAFAETQVGVLPNEYIAASWVESTGSEWINTGYVPSGTDRVEAKFRFASGSGTSGIWSSRLAGGTKTFTAIFLYGDRFRFDRNNNSGPSYKSVGSPSRAVVKDGQPSAARQPKAALFAA